MCLFRSFIYFCEQEKTNPMKKTLILLFAASAFALASCGGTTETPEQQKKDSVNSNSEYDELMKKAEQAANDSTPQDSNSTNK